MRTPVSVVIITLDEESVIERCLESVAWADEILVLDSGSTDATRELAEARGATVHQQEWLGFPKQKNVAASLARNDWILSIDADEIVTPQLIRSLTRVTARPMDPRDGYATVRRGDFLGALLPNTTRSNRRFVRLYNRRFGECDESMHVHELIRVPGRVRLLRGPLLHWNDFSLDDLITLSHRFAVLEAEELHRNGHKARATAVVYRPILRFGWQYLIRGEARAGQRGLVHSALEATREFMRYALLWELQRHPEFARRPPGARSRHGGHGADRWADGDRAGRGAQPGTE